MGPVPGGGRSSALTTKRRPSSWSGSEAGSVAVAEFCACDGMDVMAVAATVQAVMTRGTNLVMAEPPVAPQPRPTTPRTTCYVLGFAAGMRHGNCCDLGKGQELSAIGQTWKDSW